MNSAPDANPAFSSLESQLKWYDRKANESRLWYKTLKLLQIGCGAAIPLTVGLQENKWLSGGLGAMVVLLEGVQTMNQFQQHWISYRIVAERLRREKMLYSATAGPYREVPQPDVLLAERMEAIFSGEQTKWLSFAEGNKGEQKRAA
jgi:hypothetical protein